MKKVDIIIPVYNEKKIVSSQLNILHKKFKILLKGTKWKFVIVNNGSTDGTNLILEKIFKKKISGIIISEKEPNYGKALKKGLNFSNADYVFLCDIEQWDFPFFEWCWINRSNYDYFIGSRRSDFTINYSPMLRKILSWGFNMIINFLFYYMGTDTHGPKFINLRKLKKTIKKVKSERGQFDTELGLRLMYENYRIAEAPIQYIELRLNKFPIFKKIGWNIVAIIKMYFYLKNIKFKKNPKFNQFSREDVLKKALIKKITS